jgi:hypothetical protein
MPDDDGSLDLDDELLLDPNEGGLTVDLLQKVGGLCSVHCHHLVFGS